MIVALSVPLATAALAGDSLTDTTTTTTDSSTLHDTTDSTAETVEGTADTTTKTVEDTTTDPSPSPTELTSTIEETASELKSTVDDATAAITGEEPTEEPSGEASPTDSEPDETPEQPSDDSSGEETGADGGDATSDDPAVGTGQAAVFPTAPGTSSRPDRHSTGEELASYADSDPHRNFTAAGTDPAHAHLRRGSDVLGDRYGLTQQPPLGNAEQRPTRDAHVPAFLLADPYGGESAHHASGPRSTVDILRRLKAIDAGPAEIVGVLAPFPVIGPASYSDDWHAPRDGGARLHKGTDVFAPRGTPVIAVASGTITRLSPSGGLGGRTVHLTTDDGTYFYYAHLDAFHVRLAEGQRVTAGSLLGFVGNTGNARTTPPHLHFEIHPAGRASVPPLPQLDTWLGDARARLAELEAQKSGQPHAAAGEGLIPLVAPPAWTEDETNWTQGERAGAGLAATTAQGTTGPATHSATTAAHTGHRPIDRGALWLVVLVLSMVGLQRLLTRPVRGPEPFPSDLDGLLAEELRRFLDDADRARHIRRDSPVGVS